MMAYLFCSKCATSCTHKEQLFSSIVSSKKTERNYIQLEHEVKTVTNFPIIIVFLKILIEKFDYYESRLEVNKIGKCLNKKSWENVTHWYFKQFFRAYQCQKSHPFNRLQFKIQ